MFLFRQDIMRELIRREALMLGLVAVAKQSWNTLKHNRENNE
jgi:hypothetical protein